MVTKTVTRCIAKDFLVERDQTLIGPTIKMEVHSEPNHCFYMDQPGIKMEVLTSEVPDKFHQRPARKAKANALLLLKERSLSSKLRSTVQFSKKKHNPK